MIGFSSVGPQFDPNVTKNVKVFRTLTVLLLISRALLAIQYAIVTAYVARKRKEATKPLILIVLIFVITSATYLGLSVAFSNDKRDKLYYIWYILLAFEIFAIMGISIRWRSLSFKRTHLAERLGLLTLIILGEGVIVLTKSVNYVVNSDGWTWTSFGQVLAVVLTIYFLWALYFDRHPETHFGTIRQQIWCILHFPFHIGLVLMLEGINNFILYHKAISEVIKVFSVRLGASATFTDFTQTINATISTLKLSDGKGADGLTGIYSALNYFSTLSDAPEDEQSSGLHDLLSMVLTAVLKKFGFSPPKSAKVGDGQDPGDAVLSVVTLGYEYFFASAGVVVFLLAVFLWFVRRRKDVFDYASIAIRIVASFILFGCVFFTYNDDLLFNYLQGPMILPTILLLLLIILIVDKIADLVAIWRGKAKYPSLEYGVNGVGHVSQPISDEGLRSEKTSVRYAETPYPPTSTIAI